MLENYINYTILLIEKKFIIVKLDKEIRLYNLYNIDSNNQIINLNREEYSPLIWTKMDKFDDKLFYIYNSHEGFNFIVIEYDENKKPIKIDYLDNN